MTDYSWNAINLMIITQAETGTYLICACLPTYRRFVLNCSFRGKTQHTHTYTGTSLPTFCDPDLSRRSTQKHYQQQQQQPNQVPAIFPQRPESVVALNGHHHDHQDQNDTYPLTFVANKNNTPSHHKYPSYASSLSIFGRSSCRLNESPCDTMEQHIDHAHSQDLE